MVRGNGKYLVLKNTDLDQYLDSDFEYHLHAIVQEVEARRMADGKVDDNHYVVINKDEPYIDEIIAILKKHGHWEEETK